MVKLFAKMSKLFAVLQYLFIMLELLHNYFDNRIKLFIDLYLVKFLDALTKLFFSHLEIEKKYHSSLEIWRLKLHVDAEITKLKESTWKEQFC